MDSTVVTNVKRRTVLKRALTASAAVCLTDFASHAHADSSNVLVDPLQPISAWKSDGSKPRPDWANQSVSGVDAISVTADSSVGILHREASFDASASPILSWRWRAEVLPANADLARTDADDVGAGFALVFGPLGLFKKSPPMLVYIWTSVAEEIGQIVDCIRHPDTMRFVVMRNRDSALGEWRDEQRNIVEDYREAFGSDPADRVHAVALWADSDQTGGKTVAAFGPASVRRA